MPDERLVEDIENILNTVIKLGGQNERTSIYPNLLVRDANPTGLSGFVIVADPRDQDNILAKKVPGVIYNDNDLVNVIFTEGGEAIAFQQGSESSSSGLWAIVPGTDDIYYNAGDVAIGKSVAPDAALEVLSNSQAQLRLTFEEDVKFTTQTVDTNHHFTIDPSSTGQIILDAYVNFSGGTQDYLWSERSGNLTLQGQSAANNTILEIYANDGDGTDYVGINLFAVATPADITNRERLQVRYDPAQYFEITTEAAGTGTVRPIILYTGANTNQLYLGTNSTVSIKTSDTTFTGEGSVTTPDMLVLSPDSAAIRTGAFLRKSNTASRSPQNTFLRSSAAGGAVSDGWRVGNFLFEAHDGTDYNQCAAIQAEIDGAVAANTVPTRLAFLTTETNSGGLTERMNIAADGIITVNGDFIFAGGAQDYEVSDRGIALAISGQTASSSMAVELFTNDGDGTDNSGMNIYGVGTQADITNRERLQIRYDSAQYFAFQIEASGTGTVRPLIFYTGANTNQLYLDSNGRLGINSASPSAKLHIDQSSATGAIPPLYLDQADVSEDFIRFVGSAAAATLTQSIVAEADVTTATRQGFLKIYVQDDGNQITDQAYFIPIFTLA